MRVLLLAGLGPSLKNEDYLDQSLFKPETLAPQRRAAVWGGFDLTELIDLKSGSVLLRSRKGKAPHLTSATLRSILESADVDYDFLDLEDVWNGHEPRDGSEYGVVLLSTTFIWQRHVLGGVIERINQWCPAGILVLGGQYSNLKYRQIIRDHPGVHSVIRGDGEEALPLLLRALAGAGSIAEVPNLVLSLGEGEIHENPVREIDLETYPSPSFSGVRAVVPYESMRGCPFGCKFCSFPAASPKWRYKSSDKIINDWRRYAEINGATYVKAMDSTFTVPPTRLNALLDRLPRAGLRWQAYSRANSLKSRDLVDRLVDAGCASLSIGFESMNSETLLAMDKRVRVRDNLLALELLSNSPLHYKVSFLAGYPGETPEDFADTQRFLVGDYSGHFMLSVFSIEDETMPLWRDAERFRLVVHDKDNPNYSWSHSGMTAELARQLVRTTLDEVRRKNGAAVLKLWQAQYDMPLLESADVRQNWEVEKCVERLAMLGRDYADPRDARGQLSRLVDRLADLGVGTERAQNTNDTVR